MKKKLQAEADESGQITELQQENTRCKLNVIRSLGTNILTPK